MISKHILLNNKQITNSINLIRDIKPKSRVLVSNGSLQHSVENGRLTDFFDIVIAESIQAKNNLGFSDILFYTEASAYKDGLFYLDRYAEFKDTILITNFAAIKDLVKLKRDLGIFNLNFVPTSCLCNSGPGGPLQNELSSKALGVHLALVMGATTIYTDYPAAGANVINSDDLKTFLTAKKSIRPANMLSTSRTALLKELF